MKKVQLLLLGLLIFACSKAETTPEEPEPTSFLEKYDRTVWNNPEIATIGFVDDVTQFLWTIGTDCSAIGEGSSTEDGNTASIRINTNTPEEFIYTLAGNIGESDFVIVRTYTVTNNTLTEDITITFNGDQETINNSYNKFSGQVADYCS